jgi:replicative DNA helicase
MPSEIFTPIYNHQQQAEQLFAACAFISPDTTRETSGWLQEEDIHDDRIRLFWKLIKTDYKISGDQISAAITAGIYTDLMGWQVNVFSSQDSVQFANEIAVDNFLSRVAMLQNKIIGAINERRTDEVKRLIQTLASDCPDTKECIPHSTDIGLEYAETIYDKPTPVVKTWITNFDRACSGLEYRTMTILAARPSMGKSTLAWQIGRNVAAHKQKVLFFSLEMRRQSLWQKAVCGAARIDRRKVVSNDLTDAQKELLCEKNTELMAAYEDRLFVDDRSYQTIETLWQRTASIKPDLVIMDHLGLIADKERDPVRRLGIVTWGLHNLAKELNCVLMVLCQLNRATDGRENKRPTLVDLRWSGEIEQNADNVLFIYRQDYYEQEIKPTEDSMTEIIFGKYREGVRNIAVGLRYNLLDQWFYERMV